MPFGIIDTTYVDLPAGIDDAYVRGLQTRAGLSVADMIREVDAAMTAINEGADAIVADLTFQTSDVQAGVRGIGTKTVMRAGEYTVGRGQQSKRASHMLPIAKYEVVTGFTEDGLEAISLSSFRQELNDIVQAYQRFYVAQTLDRLFSAAEVPVDEGTSVLSPGFAGSGTGANVFGGNYPDGTALPGGYTHYAYTSVANLATAIKTYTARLLKWHTGPFELIASPSALDLVTALPGFVFAGSPLIRPAQGTAEALVDPANYVGVLNGVLRVRKAVEGIGSTNHIAIFKSYGQFDSRNPLAWRWDPIKGKDVFTRSRALYPLADSVVLQWLGIGVYDRVGAALIYVNDAAVAYVAPTISIV